MESFEQLIQKACDEHEIPGAVLAASSADGTFNYVRAFGLRSLSSPSPLKTDATMWLASCTKFVTSIAALQCVERGLFGLDDDVTPILTELKGREILTGFDDGGNPVLVPNTKVMTLRHLLTHQSGLCYDNLNPLLQQYRTLQNREFGWKASFKNRTLAEATDMPLIFPPGERWEYGVSLDLAGAMVERATNLTLEKYVEKYIWTPLGIKDITFHPLQNPSVMEKLADMTVREGGLTMFGTTDSPEAKVVHTDETTWDLDMKVCFGGAGLYGNVVEYQKMLHSICVDDGKLLKSSTIEEMFSPQLSPGAKAYFNAVCQIPALNDVFGGLPADIERDHGLGGMIVMKSLPGRREGTMSWGGLPNLLHYIDRKTGMSGMIGTQIIPPGDPKVVALNQAWNEAIYGSRNL